MRYRLRRMRQLRQQMARDVGDRFQPFPTFAQGWGHLPKRIPKATFAGRAAAAHWRRPDTAAWRVWSPGSHLVPGSLGTGLQCTDRRRAVSWLWWGEEGTRGKYGAFVCTPWLECAVGHLPGPLQAMTQYGYRAAASMVCELSSPCPI